MANFEIGDISAAPGELAFGRMPVGQYRDGSTVTIPLMVMHGVHEGPVLWMDSTIHGEEIAAIEVIRRIMREEVKPEDLHGIIVAAPVVNPFDFQAGGMANLLYGGSNADAHGVFPGDPKGSTYQRLAHRVFTEGILKCDYYISFHSNFYPAVEFIPVTVCEDKDILEKSIAWSEAIGLPLTEIRGATGWPGYNAQQAGKPAIIIELLYQGYFNKRSVNIGVLATLNALRHLDMIAGEPEPLPGLLVPPGRYGRGYLYSNAGGLVDFRKDAGDWVETGEVIAIIRDVYGDVLEEVKVAMQGYIRTLLFERHIEAVNEGEVIASILEADPDGRYFAD